MRRSESAAPCWMRGHGGPLQSMDGRPGPQQRTAHIIMTPHRPPKKVLDLAETHRDRHRDPMLILGAVAYDPKVVAIWNGFARYFAAHGLAFDYALFTSYERQVESHLAGHIDVAWTRPTGGPHRLREVTRARTSSSRDECRIGATRALSNHSYAPPGSASASASRRPGRPGPSRPGFDSPRSAPRRRSSRPPR